MEFQPTRPLRGATPVSDDECVIRYISTHAPLAGRDGTITINKKLNYISTHAPLAGRDAEGRADKIRKSISTHAPLAGRD